jgi:hypothetical protein
MLKYTHFHLLQLNKSFVIQFILKDSTFKTHNQATIKTELLSNEQSNKRIKSLFDTLQKKRFQSESFEESQLLTQT